MGDVERATAFFRDQLGLPFLFTAPPGLAFFDCGGVRLMVTKPQGAGAVGANSILYFKVPDIVAAHSALQARGVVFERPPALVARMPDHELWLAPFRGAHLPIDGSIWVPAVARASCPWVWVKPSDMGKMPMPLAPPAIGRCASFRDPDGNPLAIMSERR